MNLYAQLYGTTTNRGNDCATWSWHGATAPLLQCYLVQMYNTRWQRLYLSPLPSLNLRRRPRRRQRQRQHPRLPPRRLRPQQRARRPRLPLPLPLLLRPRPRPLRPLPRRQRLLPSLPQQRRPRLLPSLLQQRSPPLPPRSRYPSLREFPRQRLPPRLLRRSKRLIWIIRGAEPCFSQQFRPFLRLSLFSDPSNRARPPCTFTNQHRLGVLSGNKNPSVSVSLYIHAPCPMRLYILRKFLLQT